MLLGRMLERFAEQSRRLGLRDVPYRAKVRFAPLHALYYDA